MFKKVLRKLSSFLETHLWKLIIVSCLGNTLIISLGQPSFPSCIIQTRNIEGLEYDKKQYSSTSCFCNRPILAYICLVSKSKKSHILPSEVRGGSSKGSKHILMMGVTFFHNLREIRKCKKYLL